MSTLINLIFLGVGFILGCKLMGTSVPTDPEETDPTLPTHDAPTEKLALKQAYAPLFLPGQGRLTPAQEQLRRACGLEPPEVLTPEAIDKETRVIIKRNTPPARYKLRIRKPGQRSRFYYYSDRAQALAAYDATDKRNYPDETEVEFIDMEEAQKLTSATTPAP